MEKNKKKRGRPTILTPDTERLIASRVRVDQEKPPEQRALRKVLAYEIQQEITRNWNEQSPELSTLEKRISHYRSIPKQPFDELWTLGSLVEHPIPSDAMPIVMAAYKRTLTGDFELTVRETQWIGRLYKITDNPELVLAWALLYATEEWISEVTRRPFDTTNLDLELVRNPQYAAEWRRGFERDTGIWGIAEKYSVGKIKSMADLDETVKLFTQLNALDLPIKEIEEIAKSGKCRKALATLE